MRLYELTGAWLEAIDALEAAQTPEEIEAAHLLIAEIGEELETKLVNVAKVRASIEAEAEAYKTEEDRLRARRIALENSAERLKRYAETSMIQAGLETIKGDVFTLKIQQNAPSVLVTDEKSIPSDYWIQQEPKLDKRTLLDALKSLPEGETIPGAEIQRTKSIRIK